MGFDIGLAVVLLVACSGLAYSFSNFRDIFALPEGTKRMMKTAAAIREGANAFLKREWQEMRIVIFALAVIFGVVIQWESFFTFLLGAYCARYAAIVGLKVASYANVRVANIARITKNKGKSTRAGLKGSSITSLCFACGTLIGFVVIFTLLDYQFKDVSMSENWLNFLFSPFMMSVSTYGFGNSLVAIYLRMGGGMFTKACDMGGDLVGKVEQGIPEDHYLNAATIADNAGDIVGDSCGFIADMQESFTSAIATPILILTILFCRFAAIGLDFPIDAYFLFCKYGLYVASIGVVASMIAIWYSVQSAQGDQDIDPRKILAKLVAVAAAGTIVGSAILTYVMFDSVNFGDLQMNLGHMSPYYVVLVGIISGLAMAVIFNYYTSSEYVPVKSIADAAKQGSGIVVTQGMAVAYKSTLAIAVVIAISYMLTDSIAGILGAPLAAVGMLSFSPVMVAIDAFGPIADNAGGIAEMCGLSSNVRKITDAMDEVGNSTAAIGKGFSIGSAAYSAIAMMVCFIYSVSPLDTDVSLNILEAVILSGGIVGGAMVKYFSGMTIQSVSILAQKVVVAVQDQIANIPGLREALEKVADMMKRGVENEEEDDNDDGVRPDYEQCVGIATEGALKEMKPPALLAVVVPVGCGFVFGVKFVEGFLMVSTIVATLLAVYAANFGGACDNAKKLIESRGEKGTPHHKASTVGDTVGDPLKDTQGPSLNILIKAMNMSNIIFGPVYAKVNLAMVAVPFFKSLF